MRQSQWIVFASNNRNKWEEFCSLLKAYGNFELVPADQVVKNAAKIGLVETSMDYLENAVEKARLINHASHYPCLADDSGLEVDALGGKPGARSHRFAIAKAGISQDQANNEKLLEELRGVPQSKRGARFKCALAIVMEGILIKATGTLEGHIAEAPAGKNGFGYDCIFIPKGFNQTLAQMNSQEKNKISHRVLALQDLMNQVATHGIVFSKP
jgi:XTP/dITP diphosphohydrolase